MNTPTIVSITAAVTPFPTLAEAAKEKNISPWTLRRAIYERRLAAVRFGGSTRGKIRIRREDLEAFVLRSRTAAFGEKRPVKH